MKVVSRILIGSGNAYNLVLGAEPFRVEVDLISTDNNSIFYTWNGRNQEEGAVNITDSTEYGIKIAEGVTTICDTTAKGISLYDGSKTQMVLVPSPVPGIGDVKVAVNDYTVTRSTNATARSGTAIGTILRPTVHNNYVYECTFAGTGSAEPDPWPTPPGEAVTDGTVIFTCRRENIVAGKGIGVTLGATLLASTDLFFVRAYIAEQGDDILDIGTPT